MIGNLVTTLDTAWRDVMRNNPDVRPAVVIVYHNRKRSVRGMFTRMSWTVRSDGSAIDEVHIDSIILGEGGESIMRTLLHEAAHSIAVQRDVRDVSRGNRWHNKRFKAIAEEVGLVVERDSMIGHVTPGLTQDASAMYTLTVSSIDSAINAYQSSNSLRNSGTTRTSSTVKMGCPVCFRVFRCSRKTADGGDIICATCRCTFVEVQTGDDDEA